MASASGQQALPGAGEEGFGGVMRFPLPNSSPVGPAVAAKWGIWRDILSGRSPAERARLLRHATQAFNHFSELEASCAAGDVDAHFWDVDFAGWERPRSPRQPHEGTLILVSHVGRQRDA